MTPVRCVLAARWAEIQEDRSADGASSVHRQSMATEPIKSVYRPFGDGGRFLLYAGGIEFPALDVPVPGQVELELNPGIELRVHLIGPGSVSARADAEDPPTFTVPLDADLTPPGESVLAERKSASARAEFPAGRMTAGRLEQASRLLLHVGGGFDSQATPRRLTGGGFQPQIDFSLPGWDLVLVPGTVTRECHDFAAIISAAPTTASPSEEAVDRLRRRLFILLSFIANREVDGPACGLRDDGTIAWAEWTSPRIKPGKSAVTWCPAPLVEEAIPELAKGLSTVASDEDLEVIVDRAIGYSLAANGEEVIEVRIPIVCSGLELLAWAVLQRESWLIDSDSHRRLGTAARVRLLLKWAGIPTAVPSSLPLLAAHLATLGRPEWEGPEILFNIRNAMVHPPRRLSEPEWPDAELLVEAWLLGTWYLELALLRILGYQGRYWSRIRLNRPAADGEPVPWCASV
jgi:hypothetical protein